MEEEWSSYHRTWFSGPNKQEIFILIFMEKKWTDLVLFELFHQVTQGRVAFPPELDLRQRTSACRLLLQLLVQELLGIRTQRG
jgi:hypothetical protein